MMNSKQDTAEKTNKTKTNELERRTIQIAQIKYRGKRLEKIIASLKCEKNLKKQNIQSTGILKREAKVREREKNI